MSEPLSAFLKIEIDFPGLVRWLESPPPRASRWRDWRSIGGRYYVEGGDRDIADFSESLMAEKLLKCDAWFARFSTNRAVLQDILGTAEAPHVRIAAPNRSRTVFICGSLTYAENLIDYLFFLAFARGVAEFLAPERHGLAVLHNYIWGSEDERRTQAALRLGSGLSEFMSSAEHRSASGAFDQIVTAMFEDREDPEFSPRDQLDRIR